MKRQSDKGGSMRHNKRTKESLSSRRNYRNHESSRDTARESRDDNYSSSRSYSRQNHSREQDVQISPSDRYRESKRDSSRKTEKTYRTLAVENFSSQISNEDIEESLYFEYRKFGDVSVRVVESHGNRIAYVTFKLPECASDAKNAKGTLVMYDRRLSVEAVYERKTSNVQDKKYDSDHYDRKKDAESRGRRERGRSRSPTPVRPKRSKTPTPPRSSRYENGDRSYNSRRSPKYDDVTQRSTRHSMDYDDDSRYSNHSPENGRGVNNDLPPEDDPYATRTLFVGDLEVNTTIGNVRRAFEVYGRIDDVDVKHSPHGKGCYAFVRFSHLDSAHKAKANMQGRKINDSVIRVGYGKPVISSKLWVGGLGSWITLGALEREFDRFGSIRKIDYERGSDHAFVLYESLDAAREACSQMKGTTMPGSDVKLRIDFADPAPGLPGWDDRDKKEDRSDDRRFQNNHDRRFSRGGRGRNGYDNRNNRYDNRKFRDNDRGNERFNRSRTNQNDTRYNRRRSNSPFNNRNNQFKPPEIDRQLLFKQAQAKGVVDLHQLCEVFNPPLWDGCLLVKKTAFAVRFFCLDGDLNVLYKLLEHNSPGNNTDLGTFLKVDKKLKLDEEEKINAIAKRSEHYDNKWCLLLAVPGMPTIVNIAGGKSAESIFGKQRPLRGLVKYFKEHKSAGVVHIKIPNKNANSETAKETVTSELLYAFPPSKFTKDKLFGLAPNLNEEVIIDEYLVILILKSNLVR